MSVPTVRFWRRLVNATRCSWSGLRAGLRTQAALRQELLVLVLLIPAAWMLKSGGLERALLIGSWVWVVIVEIINSAVEAIVDRIGAERHELSGRAKDLGSAAVFCSILLAAWVWVLILTSP